MKKRVLRGLCVAFITLLVSACTSDSSEGSDTGSDVATGVNDTGGDVATGDNDTGDDVPTGDTSTNDSQVVGDTGGGGTGGFDTSGGCIPEAWCDNQDHVLWFDDAHCAAAGAQCMQEAECEYFNVCSPRVCPHGGEGLAWQDDCPQDVGCYGVTNGTAWKCIDGTPCTLGDEVATDGCPVDATCYEATGASETVTCIESGRPLCESDELTVVGGCHSSRLSGGCREVTSEIGETVLCVPEP